MSDKPESKLPRSSVLKSFATLFVMFKSLPTASTAASPVVPVAGVFVAGVLIAAVSVLAVCWHAIRNIKNNDRIASVILFFISSPFIFHYYCIFKSFLKYKKIKN